MNVNKYNVERYYDPTVYEALVNIEKETNKKIFRKIIYVCSPYAGDLKYNIKQARKYCRYTFNHGCIPIAPHLLFPQFMDDSDPEERELALSMNKILLLKCSEIWVFGDIISNGMAIEIAEARSIGKLIRYFYEHCKEVSN